MKKDLEILYAKPTEEPDRGKVKWPKLKWKRPRGRTEYRRNNRRHPGTRKARNVLESIGRPLNICEHCGLQGPHLSVHHKDHNPYNNDAMNLVVLCKFCHAKEHGITDLIDVKPWHYGTIQVDEELW